MKKFVIWRHAKSSWEDAFLSDHERPLASRGIRDTPEMADRLLKQGIKPDLLVSSDANRALATAKLAAVSFHFPEKNILTMASMYHAGPQALLRAIRQTEDVFETVFFFGHNPGMTDLVILLGGELDNLPTCGQYGFRSSAASWRDISPDNTQFWFYDFPKSKLADI
ncbi:MAG: histidine phosphatase family protein [Lunatimonas sp.]|uniref:SixA phosphatase family protein n=1 Tax=Lunatimonas sp. TaxID=2060141 RepID=UPI00263AC720|nr:histidine phosphatase family protein [Lunatimonas sp.]MCC5939087.1 histidine phosphatase family protein [Lunatimonas sp.]